MHTDQVPVTTTPTPLHPTDTGRPIEVIATNQHATTPAYLGDHQVTTTTGYQLAAGQTRRLPIGTGETLHAITATGTVRVDVHTARTATIAPVGPRAT